MYTDMSKIGVGGPYLWIDMEMSGLDHKSDKIMEFACILTMHDKKGGTRKVIGPERVLHCPDEVLESMGEWCTSYHTSSGLVDACRKSRHTVAQVESEVIQFLTNHGITPNIACLAGSSVHVDKLFLMRDMPKLIEFLHYRILDVSSIRLIRRHLTHLPEPRKQTNHRAMDDIENSISTLESYMEEIVAGAWSGRKPA